MTSQQFILISASLGEGHSRQRRSRCISKETVPKTASKLSDHHINQAFSRRGAFCPTSCTCTEWTNRAQRSSDDVITFTVALPITNEFVREPMLKVDCAGAGFTGLPAHIPSSTTKTLVVLIKKVVLMVPNVY